MENQEELKGNIHSIESFGTLDGPGIRLVVFFQGCPMRCLYCHNPDSWSFSQNKLMEADEIIEKYNSTKAFRASGGITASGGEALSQIDFLIHLFKKAKENKIHTALDTSGVLFNAAKTDKFDELIKYTDLVLLDIKHIDNDEHIKLTGQSNKNVLLFAKYLSDKNVPVWIRHVVVPNYTDSEIYLAKLGKFLTQLKNIEALDVLAYHDMAKVKYEKMNLEYKLKDVKPLSKDEAIKARNIILAEMKCNKT